MAFLQKERDSQLNFQLRRLRDALLYASWLLFPQHLFPVMGYCSLFCLMHSQKSKDTGDYRTCCEPMQSRKIPAEDFAFQDGEIVEGSNSESEVPLWEFCPKCQTFPAGFRYTLISVSVPKLKHRRVCSVVHSQVSF